MFMQGQIKSVMADLNLKVSSLMCQTINEHLFSKENCAQTIQGLIDKAASKFVCMEKCDDPNKNFVIGSDF